MNPGGSVKDRAALYVVQDAEEKGLHSCISAADCDRTDKTWGNSGGRNCWKYGYRTSSRMSLQGI